jgi:LemA protein
MPDIGPVQERVMPALILILLFAIAVFGYIFYAYNRLTQLRNTLQTEWSDVDVLLNKRADLIPNIIEVVKGYAKHERETLEAVAKARTAAMAAGTGRGKEETELSGFVASVFALREQYPDLKANQDFKDLQNRLFELEEQIAERRTNYNDVVKAHNDFVLKFPGNLVAALVGFSLVEPFEFVGSREVPAVILSNPDDTMRRV